VNSLKTKAFRKINRSTKFVAYNKDSCFDPINRDG
jgi:hypothetical protein